MIWCCGVRTAFFQRNIMLQMSVNPNSELRDDPTLDSDHTKYSDIVPQTLSTYLKLLTMC